MYEHNVGADRNCMHTKFGGAQSRDRNFKRPKIGKKCAILSRYVLVTTDEFFEHTTYDRYGYNHLIRFG